MAKRYRRKPAANTKTTPEKKPFPWKKALILFGLIIAFFSFYRIAIYLYWAWVLHAYCIAIGVLALAYVLWNRGIFTALTPADLPDAWSKEKKDAFLNEQQKRKKQSSFLLYLLIPMMATVIFDMVYLFLELNMGFPLP